ncbi:BlaI/MecI/CopY family transcriptional regulator [soil metagenome]
MARRNQRPRGPTRVEELLGPLEAACLRALWGRSPSTVGEVRTHLNSRRDSALAYTTVMTVLSRLHDKGFAIRDRQGRGYAYSPASSERELVDSLSRDEVSDLVERYGDIALARFAETLHQSDPQLLQRTIELAREDQQDG